MRYGAAWELLFWPDCGNRRELGLRLLEQECEREGAIQVCLVSGRERARSLRAVVVREAEGVLLAGGLAKAVGATLGVEGSSLDEAGPQQRRQQARATERAVRTDAGGDGGDGGRRGGGSEGRGSGEGGMGGWGWVCEVQEGSSSGLRWTAERWSRR